ncbi:MULTISPECIES: hypothetical protein [Micromonospora]|uniref:Uncharacterized protein n=1 Tax=Micromonospora inaquosa TaxID=2203716 RepID=A0A3N9X569_9ACTN|nr:MULTISPECIES: hypothetical protein [Micromonospora]RQX02493.1 hypothetical protein DLJ59_15175 [Micromonospora inaquosa]
MVSHRCWLVSGSVRKRDFACCCSGVGVTWHEQAVVADGPGDEELRHGPGRSFQPAINGNAGQPIGGTSDTAALRYRL